MRGRKALADRKEITKALQKATVGWLVKRGYGVTVELGVMPWGRRKVDVIGIKGDGHIVIAEIKSCKADFTTDKKMLDYLPFCDQFVLVTTTDCWKEIEPMVTEKRIGARVLGADGYLVSVRPAPNVKMDGKTRKSIVLRIAYRNATFSKRNTRRTKVFIK
jgi:hypothetical protein